MRYTLKRFNKLWGIISTYKGKVMIVILLSSGFGEGLHGKRISYWMITHKNGRFIKLFQISGDINNDKKFK